MARRGTGPIEPDRTGAGPRRAGAAGEPADATGPPDPAAPAGAGPGSTHVELAEALDGLIGMLRRIGPAGEFSLTALSTLRVLDAEGGHRLSDLAVREGVSQPAMTQLAGRLERDGLVRRRADPADGRVVIFAITDQGRRLLHRRRQVRAERLAGLLASLDPGDEAAIRAALPALDRLARQAQATAPGRPIAPAQITTPAQATGPARPAAGAASRGAGSAARTHRPEENQ